MKTQLEIMIKWEVMEEAVHNLRMKPELTDFERLYIIQMESNMNELKWVLDIKEPMTNEEIQEQAQEDDRMAGFADDMKEEEMENDSEDTLSI